jgi:L-asparaginase
MTESARPAVTLFALGGTIAAPVDTTGSNATFTLSATDITAAVPQIAEVADVTAVSFLNVPSAGLTFDDLVSLAIAIDEAADAGDSGVVVTQGTDTLEETAWLLDNLVGSDIPVVVTGAMRNVGKPGADGPANLLAAVQVAANELAAGIGTLVVFNDEIHAARSVVKTHSSSPATFRSPGAGPLGWITEGRVRIPFVPRRRTPRVPLRAGAAIPTVALVRLVLDDDGSLIEHLIGSSHAGVIVEVFGGGHVPAALVPALSRLAAAKVVVFSSRTGAGELYRAVGNFPGSEQDLLANGLISAVILNGPKARVLLRLLLASGASPGQIEEAFADTVL